MSDADYTARTVRGEVLHFMSFGATKYFVSVNEGRMERVTGMRRDVGESVEWDDGSGILHPIRPGPVIRVEIEGRVDPLRMVADSAGEAAAARYLGRP